MGNTQGDLCCKLRAAAQLGKVEACIELIAHGAKIGCQDNVWLSTPLHEACRYGHSEVASLLLRSACSVDPRDCVGQTPLFYAAKGGFDCILEKLLAHGADVRAVSSKGRSPLHNAMQGGHRVSALLLVERGADALARDCDGSTPVQLAARTGSLKGLMICLSAQGPRVRPHRPRGQGRVAQGAHRARALGHGHQPRHGPAHSARAALRRRRPPGARAIFRRACSAAAARCVRCGSGVLFFVFRCTSTGTT
jgi:hypothetical protein